MSRIHIVILAAVRSFCTFVAMTLLTTVIHEGAHLIAAVIMKVPIASFTWFDPCYLAPMFVSGSTEHTLGMQAVGYTGGDWLLEFGRPIH